MKKGTRTVIYDNALHIEAYRLRGIEQSFHNHFHEYYVIGLVESGTRVLRCRNREYTIEKGDILLFHPGDSHSCVQSDGGALDYRGINITKEVMLDLAEEVTGRRSLPGFSRNVIFDREAACRMRLLHELVMRRSRAFDKEENLLLLLTHLIQKYGQPFENCVPECRAELEKVCAFLERHYDRHICLDEIARCAGLSRSALLRAFAKEKGTTPYSYLESIRIGKAKALLEQGALPVEAALRTGFSDQSHFTNYFCRYIGLPPGLYREIFFDKDTGGAAHEK